MPLASDTLPLQVDNIGFLLDRLGEDCHPLQFLRELTQNAIEAILRTPEKRGEIVWDVDWLPQEVGERQPFKLCITDTGDGMTGEEMVHYINQLSSSKGVQSSQGNFGMGAKIAAATRNHEGLVYLSWKSGRGAMVHLWRNPRDGQYGLRRVERPDGTYDSYAEVEDDVKPSIIGDHGTKIVLWGNTPDADTMEAPKGVPSPSTWIGKYVNTRYYRIPEGITVKARQGWEQPRGNTDVNLLRTIEGQASYLAKHKEASGTVQLTGAVAHWWILRDEPALSQNSGHIESAGHIAALHKDELYELQTGRSGSARLQQFGVVFGPRRVVIYVEPSPAGRQALTTNTARTQLLIGSQALPWSDWAGEFRANMPAEITALMERIASDSSETDHSKGIRERLKALLDLYKVSRYRPAPAGQLRIDEPMSMSGGASTTDAPSTGDRPTASASTRQREGMVGGVYSAFLKKDGKPGIEARPDLFPKVDWISIANGKRERGQMEDRAAQYLKEQNRLLINADFRVFADMIGHWLARYKEHADLPGFADHVRETVHSWFEQALVETVIGLQALRGSPEWPRDKIDMALSEEALTAVVMQRYHPYNAVKRELGTKIGSLKTVQ